MLKRWFKARGSDYLKSDGRSVIVMFVPLSAAEPGPRVRAVGFAAPDAGTAVGCFAFPQMGSGPVHVPSAEHVLVI